VFRRTKSAETDATAADVSATEPATGGKGAPTPTRKEAEAARKARLQGTSDPRAARKAQKEADRQARYEARMALQTGDERKLPPRDAGPVKAWVRDYVDGRRSAGELFIPVAVVVLIAGFVRVQWVQVGLLWLWSVMLIGVVADSLYLWWRLRTRVPELFPDQDRRGSVSYGILRSLQIRKLRLPPPKVKANGQPVVPKAPRR
jgi:hypothetical protein